jgi:hypothetical protein
LQSGSVVVGSRLLLELLLLLEESSSAETTVETHNKINKKITTRIIEDDAFIAVLLSLLGI